MAHTPSCRYAPCPDIGNTINEAATWQNDVAATGEMRPEYDCRGGVRGKYYKEYLKGANVVLLEPDVAAVFRDSESVNQALRVLIKAAGQIQPAAPEEPEQSR
jgi:hypothetical protein